MSDAFFRAGVGACIVDRDGLVLALKRIKEGSWQMPQGGIGIDEEPSHALLREIGEETGLTRAEVQIVSELDEWLAYELPIEHRNAKVGWGQVQRWFICDFRGPRASVKPDGVEFTGAEWITPEELLARAADFRRPIYKRVLSMIAKR